jgi:MFS family permease
VTENNAKSFWALIVTQFFGSFNDNFFKVLISLLVVDWVKDPSMRNELVSLGTGVFAAPFILFSMFAGRLADRLPKPQVIVATKTWELIVILAASAALAWKSIPLMLLCLFLLALQATFFGPVKYGILPEMMSEAELTKANAWLNASTFAAILIGTVVASHLASDRMTGAALMGACALSGLLASLLMAPLPAANPNAPLPWNAFTDLASNWRLIQQDRMLARSIIAVNFFWFMGAALQANIFLYTKEMMKAAPPVAGYLIVAIAVGVGFGSFLAARLSKGKIERGLVPVGAFGMSLFAVDLLWAHASLFRTLIDFWMLGTFAGLYYIPLVALIQWRAPAPERGRILATTNFLSFVAIALAAVVLWIFGTLLHFNSSQVFVCLGFGTAIETAFIYRYIYAPRQ